MRTVQLTLSNGLVRDLDALGLFGEGKMQAVLEEVAMQEGARREAGKHLLELMEDIHTADIEAMTMDEIVSEIDAVRGEWKVEGV